MHQSRAERRQCARCSRRGLITQRDGERPTSGSRSPILRRCGVSGSNVCIHADRPALCGGASSGEARLGSASHQVSRLPRCSVSLNRRLRGFRENEVMPTVALTRCTVPSEMIRSSRLKLGGSGGQVRELDDPADAAEHPLGDQHAADHRAGARHTEITRVPLSVSLPLVAAAAGRAVAAETASAIPAASSALSLIVSCFFPSSLNPLAHPSRSGQS